MPDSPNYFEHLPLRKENVGADRRKRKPNFAPPLTPSARASSAQKLSTALQGIGEAIAGRAPPPAGIQPHLVVRIPLTDEVPFSTFSERIEDVGLSIVSIEPDKAVVAFRSQVDLTEFQSALQKFERGPRQGINPGTGKPYQTTRWDVFQFIKSEEMRVWGREDRVGEQLSTLIGPTGERVVADLKYTVDVELWHPGNTRAARALIREVEALVLMDESISCKVSDEYVGESLCLLRIILPGSKLSQLLDVESVAEVEMPPKAVFDAGQARSTSMHNFPAVVRPITDKVRLCIVDSGITANHPLLSQNIGSEAAIFTVTTTPSDSHGHGTLVAGVAVFGSVRACYESGTFSSPVTLFSARVLNDQNQFDDEKLIINQMRAAIETFIKAPNHCKVFNLSLGSGAPASKGLLQKQTEWAEALDILARELKVLIVVSAGNFREIFAQKAEEAEAVLNAYPKYLLEDPAARLCDPATSAIAITVGSIAEYDSVQIHRGAKSGDLIRPVARANEPSPFSRTGPGLSGAIKPEFVDYGGNAVFEGLGGVRKIYFEPGSSVMSLSREPTRQLFSYDVGTSYAAPRLARKAALLWEELRIGLGEEPDPNLVRAVLASAATTPEACVALARRLGREELSYRFCGFGLVDETLALKSTEQRVTLIAQDSIKLDSFLVYEVPIPEEFAKGHGKKQIGVSLAFDPPVRRRRSNYLGVEMGFYLIRGRTLEQVVRAYQQVEPGETAEEALKAPYKVNLDPTGEPRDKLYSRKKSTLQKGTFEFSRARDGYGESYWLVVRAEKKWAPEIITHQDFALAVTLQSNEPQLYNLISQRVRPRARARSRG